MYKHLPYSAKEDWTVLRYLRKQEKKSKIQRVTRGTQCHKILVRTTSICATADKLGNFVLPKLQLTTASNDFRGKWKISGLIFGVSEQAPLAVAK